MITQQVLEWWTRPECKAFRVWLKARRLEALESLAKTEPQRSDLIAKHQAKAELYDFLSSDAMTDLLRDEVKTNGR